MLSRHLDKLNSLNRCFADSMKIFIPENNLGCEAVHMRGMIQHRHDMKTFWQKKDRPGVRKGPDTADNYVSFVEGYLRTNKLLFSTHLFTTTRGYTPKTVKAELQGQMEQYHVKIILPQHDFDKVKRIVGGKGGGNQDDLGISFYQCMYFGNVAKNAPDFCFD